MAEFFNIEDYAADSNGVISVNPAGNDKINYPGEATKLRKSKTGDILSMGRKAESFRSCIEYSDSDISIEERF
jgi:hypothetical protein